jgi:hypothetical protein
LEEITSIATAKKNQLHTPVTQRKTIARLVPVPQAAAPLSPREKPGGGSIRDESRPATYRDGAQGGSPKR